MFIQYFHIGKHVPGTEEFLGAIPKWMIQAAGGSEEAAQAFAVYGYAADSGSYGTKQVIKLIQRLLNKLGYMDVLENGFIDSQTHSVLKNRLGSGWELLRLRDIVWSLQTSVDRGDFYKNEEDVKKARVKDQKKPSSSSQSILPWILGAGALYLILK